MQGRIPTEEWNEITQATSQSSYTVQKNDWLWKISKKLFGSGFYYSKIWALNPYITNPHEIEPGMVLTFDTGTQDELPRVNMAYDKRLELASGSKGNFEQWGDNAKPKWFEEKRKLQKQGVFIQYSSGETYEDLERVSKRALIQEYRTYEPPGLDFEIKIPEEEYDASGFDKTVKLQVEFKEGFDLNTFISTNIVQDFGKVEAAIDDKELYTKYETIYLRFDDRVDVVVGDKYSLYRAQGEVSNENSDREGYKYTIVGSIKTKQKIGDVWECEVIASPYYIKRGDRITVYTPKIERITRTFNPRLIEGILIGHYNDRQTYASLGDVVYIDRGRADGVEMGNVFEVYGFVDNATGKNITDNPTYMNGELTIINLTDNFATALVTLSIRDFRIGDVVVSKSKESAAKATRLKKRKEQGVEGRIEDDALEELDVELNLDDINDDLLDRADQIKLSEEDLSELERQEREKSILTENEKDIKALERLEQDIETAQEMLNEARVNEDKWLESQSLESIEKDLLYQQQESLDEIEENFGKRYLDEDLNDKDNPYGLTEFDIEEIDELLNIESNPDKPTVLEE